MICFNRKAANTIPEVIVATNRGMKTFGVSMITNAIAKDGTNATNHAEVMAVLNSNKTEEKLFKIFKSFFSKLKDKYSNKIFR